MEEKNKKFRNHISIVFEQVGSGFYVLLGYFLWQFVGDEEMIADVTSGDLSGAGMLIAAAVIFGIILLVFVIQLIVWSKTYISIDGNTIVMEKNTINKKKQTIGIKNISNVNTEQNLFEMLVGTCKIKMDTNSLSTADSTDIKIVLKKREAEAFKNHILFLMNQKEGEEPVEVSSVEPTEGAGIRKMLVHGIYSIRFTSVFVALLGLFGFVGITVDALQNGVAGLMTILSEMLVLGLVALSGIWSIVKGFLKYYGFSARRVHNKLYIRYGLLKKVNYTIPVDKINAIRLIQSPQARVMKCYTAELINVGMGDEEEKEQSFFLMYDKEEAIKKEIETLLPEFSGCIERKLERQPASVWKVWILSEVIFLAVLAAIYGVTAEFVTEGMEFVGVALLVILMLAAIWVIMKYITHGSCVDQDVVGIGLGAFRREKIFVKYNKIQYVEASQNFLAKRYGITKATIHLLASSLNQTHVIPYFTEEKIEDIKARILK